jgi:hypothetical protein
VELVLGTRALAAFGGSESYLLTITEELERLGHRVTLTAEVTGEFADHLRERGLAVSEGDQDLPEAPDGVLVQDTVTGLRLAERYPGRRQVFLAHSAHIDLQLPAPVAGLTAVAVAMNERVAERIRSLALGLDVVRLRQPIDLRRFSPRGTTPERPRRLLLLGNYLRGRRLVELEAAAEATGIDVRRIGRHSELSTAPEREILDADLVVGYGRAVLEGMACGRAALVFDYKGGDGWVTPESYDALEADGFAGSATERVFDRAELERELAGWDPTMGLQNRDLAVFNHSPQKHVEGLLELFRASAGDGRPIEIDGMRALAGVAARAESRAVELELEAEDLRRERDEVVRIAKAAQREVVELKSTRRYRLGRALAAPLDRLRGRGPG